MRLSNIKIIAITFLLLALAVFVMYFYYPYARTSDGNLAVAELAFTNGNYRKAIRYYGFASQQEPENAYARHMLGLSYDNFGNESLALENFQKAIEIDPDWETPYGVICLVHSYNKDYILALEYCNEAIERDPNLIFALLERIAIFHTTGEFAQACKDFLHVSEIAPQGHTISKLRKDLNMQECVYDQ